MLPSMHFVSFVFEALHPYVIQGRSALFQILSICFGSVVMFFYDSHLVYSLLPSVELHFCQPFCFSSSLGMLSRKHCFIRGWITHGNPATVFLILTIFFVSQHLTQSLELYFRYFIVCPDISVMFFILFELLFLLYIYIVNV